MRTEIRKIYLAGAIVGAALIHVSGQSPESRQTTPEASFPPVLNTYITNSVRITPAERSALLTNSAVTRLLDAEPDKEVSVFGAVWIDAVPAAYVRLVKDIERFERGGPFRITKRISDPPLLGDFASLDLPDEDIADLKTCRVGHCEIKLSEEAVERIRQNMDSNKPTAKEDARTLFRKLLHEYVPDTSRAEMIDWQSIAIRSVRRSWQLSSSR
jgi:hypothetical protein